MEMFNNHKKLFGYAFLLFAGLTILVAIMPAISNQQQNKVLPGSKPLSFEEASGKQVYIANGCVACHTQQVRNVAMDKVWGARPGIAADYAGNKRINTWINTATLMGTGRIGPDLTNAGVRQPGMEWHLLHLYQPRAVVRNSIMPAYPWLFTVKDTPAPGDVVVNIPPSFAGGINGKVVASKEALYLVAYLQSLKQIKLPEGRPDPEFLYPPKPKNEPGSAMASALPDGKTVYAMHCQSCHQENGEGLPGAFPSLKGSAIVTSDNPELFINIIMNGYDAREEYAVMPGIGFASDLSPEEVTAIINHERTNWGNNARLVTLEEVRKVMDYLKQNQPPV